MRRIPLISILLSGIIAVTGLAKNEGDKPEPTTQSSTTQVDAEGWSLRVSMRAFPGELASYDRDDQIFTRIELISPSLTEAPTFLATEGVRLQVRSLVTDRVIDVPLEASQLKWKRLWGDPENRWTISALGELTNICAEFPDGDCEVSLNWDTDVLPAFKTSPIRFLLKKVTLDDARCAAEKAGDRAGPVRLEFDEEGIGGVLFNGTDRPISFSAYTSSFGGETVDAGIKSWSPINSASIYLPAGWRPLPIGWCGTGTGSVIVQPGQSARLQRLEDGSLVNQGKAIWRASIRWRYADEKEVRESFEAHTDAIEVDTPGIEIQHNR